MTNNENAIDTSDREISTTRIFDAPRDLVFKVWTNPVDIVIWWGPNGFTNTNHAMDVRPGGVWRYTMHGPDGVDYANRIEYLEVKVPELLVYNHGDDEMNGAFHVTVTFEDLGKQTRLTMKSVFRSKEERDEVIEKSGALEGLYQTLTRLSDYLVTKF
jgi:uncharacterized protein YndB with AHSA1/START domain